MVACCINYLAYLWTTCDLNWVKKSWQFCKQNFKDANSWLSTKNLWLGLKYCTKSICAYGLLWHVLTFFWKYKLFCSQLPVTDSLEGLNILLCGDFTQLFLVGNSALYTLPLASKVSVAVIAEKAAYNAFTDIVVLMEVMRQQWNLSSTCQFCEVLDQLQDEQLLSNSWQFLLFKTNKNLDIEVHTKFNNALHFYSTKSQIMASNLQHLKQLRKPVLKISATNCRKGAKSGTANDTGLENKLLLLKNSWGMITQNLWTLKKLVNSTMGMVHDIIWDDKVENPFAIIPAVILMAGDNYTGPASMVVNGVHIVSVAPAKTQ